MTKNGFDDSFSQNSENWLTQQMQRWQTLVDGIASGETQQTWSDFIQQNQKQSFQDIPADQEALLKLVSEQSSRFTEFAESLLKRTDTTDTDQLVDQFQQYMQQQCNAMLNEQWNLPEPFASLIRQQPLNRSALSEGPMREYLEKLADSPDIGNSLFSPTQVKEGAKALLDYQDALNDYLAQYDQIFNNTGERLKQLLRQDDIEIDSIKQLHNLWVDCYEKAYAETVFTDRYQASHGRISNSLMQARKLALHSRDQKLQEYGFVTRKELDSTLKQQHKMRKQLRTQQNQIDQLQQQIQLLQQQLSKPAPRNTTNTSQKKSAKKVVK